METHDYEYNHSLKIMHSHKPPSNDPRWKKEFQYLSPDITLTFTSEGIILYRERYGQNGIATSSDLTELCITLFSEHLYKDKFNMFKSVFEDNLKTAIEKVLRFYNMRTSKKNHRKFSRKMKERNHNAPEFY